MKKATPTYEWAESRRPSSAILREEREKIVAQRQILLVDQYDWRYDRSSSDPFPVPVRILLPTKREEFNHKHLKSLITHSYKKLRGLYSIPFTFDEFDAYVYNHVDVRSFSHHRFAAARRHNAAIFNRRIRRKLYPAGQWTGQYHRYGESFLQTGIEKKAEPVSDQYQVNAEEARKEWREKHQFGQKDRRWRRGAGKYYKQLINRENRRATDQLIHNEDWDHIFKYAEPRDTWRWD